MEMPHDIVLIAVDASQHSERAVRWYADHMHRPGNKVVLLHCIEMPSVPSRDTWEKQTLVGREKSKELEDKFKAILSNVQAEPKFLVDFEKPGQCICSTAESEEVSVIVMGTRGMGKVRRTILGSVSDYVIHHASCPVLICRE